MAELQPEQTNLEDNVQQQQPNPDVDVEDKRILAKIYTSEKKFPELGLREELLQGVYAMGFSHPTRIQGVAIPAMLKDPPRNFIGQAQSGTGKTAAFVLCMLSRIDETQPVTQALCLAPTRELTRQIYDVTVQLAKFTKITVALAVAGSEFYNDIDAHVVIGTPGRIVGLTSIKERKKLKTNDIRIFVLDEADIMVSAQGMQEQSQKVQEQLPGHCQICLFSATYGDLEKEFAKKIILDPELVLIPADELTLEKLGQYYIHCGYETKKFEILDQIYKIVNVGQSIIFVHTIHKAQELCEKMRGAGHEVSLLHGRDMPMMERDRIIDAFRKGDNRVLISTNVLARGFDVLTVTLVINYDIPMDAFGNPDPQTYLHRIGRSARYNHPGLAINFVHDDRSKHYLDFISAKYKKEISEIPADNLNMIADILRDMGAD